MKAAVFIVLALLAGCRVVPKAPAALVTAGAVQVVQDGPAAVPATATSKRATASIVLPAETVIQIFRPLPTDKGTPTHVPPPSDLIPSMRIVLPAAAEFVLEHAEETATGPQAFTPAAPPTPKDEAAGRAAWLYRVGLVGGLLLVGLGIGWGGKFVWMGGAAVAGASAFGWFVEDNPWLLTLMGVGVTLAASGFAVWHLWLKKRAASPAE